MDGTLVDSTFVVERAWGGWAKRHGLITAEVLQFSHGRPTVATMEHFFPGRDQSPELEEMERYEEEQTQGIIAVPGAADVVQAVKNGCWGIVTSAWRQLAIQRVTTAGLPLPRVLVSVDAIQQGKPHPEGYLQAAAQLGVEPQTCLVFEDTRPGIEAGLNAGMQVVGLLTTVTAEQLAHRPLIKDFRQIQIVPEDAGFEVLIKETI